MLINEETHPERSGTTGGSIYGKFGNNYPDHIANVNLLGFKRGDLVSLAYLRPGNLPLFNICLVLCNSICLITFAFPDRNSSSSSCEKVFNFV